MSIGINIEGGASLESVREAREAIVAIVTAGGDREITIAALEALRGLCHSQNSITNCTIYGGPKED